jgi:hypothetical protein
MAAKLYGAAAAQLKQQEQQRFDDALGRLARGGTRDCFGKTGCANQ